MNHYPAGSPSRVISFPLLCIVIILLSSFPLMGSARADAGSSTGSFQWVTLTDEDENVTVDIVFRNTLYRDWHQQWTMKISDPVPGGHSIEINIQGLSSPRKVDIDTGDGGTMKVIEFESGEFSSEKRDATVDISLSNETDVVDLWNGTVNIFDYSPPAESDETGIRFLFAAYLFIWAGLAAYVFLLETRYRHTRKDVDNLSAILDTHEKKMPDNGGDS